MTRKPPREGTKAALILKTFDAEPTLQTKQVAWKCKANCTYVNYVLHLHARRPTLRGPGRPPGMVNPGTIAERVLRVFDLEPLLTSKEIANMCGADSNYVRDILRRNGRKLWQRKRKHEARKRTGSRLSDAAV